jgi:hypothetical protein
MRNRIAIIVVLSAASTVFCQENRPRSKLLILPEGVPAEVVRELNSVRHGPVPTREALDRRFAERNVYRGTVFKLATEADRSWLLDIAMAFLKQNPHPKERLEQFAFLFNAKDISVIGWNGTIKSIVPKDGGKHGIVMNVRPDLSSRRGVVTFTPQTTKEHWEWDGQSLILKKLESANLEAIFVD